MYKNINRKLQIAMFWARAFFIIIKETIKNNDWHMIYVDFHIGNSIDGIVPKRKQLIAKKSANDFSIYWQNQDED